jgi:SAM-dependent MidA family methyltransferase
VDDIGRTRGQGAQTLPQPPPDAQAASAALAAHIRARVLAAGGRIAFDEYMELALYAPRLGYYSGGAEKLGPGGDFVTAPGLGTLYARCLARPVAQALTALGGGDVLEFGPGDGALAAALLPELAALGVAPRRYLALERSAALAARQRAALAAAGWADRAAWLERLPDAFEGVVLASEVLDALPARRLRMTDAGLVELYVEVRGEGFALIEGPLRDPAHAARLAPFDLPPGYETEANPAAEAWARTLAGTLRAGVALVVDYGYPRAAYYHPQRTRGTFRCHYRHQAHEDAFLWPGLTDLTAHLDFTALAEAALGGGAQLLGYAPQADFLIGCGLPEILAATDPADPDYAALAREARLLVLPQHMGEAFGVLAFGRGVDLALAGFARDHRHRL